MSVDVFVYFRSAADDRETRRTLEQLQRALAREFGVGGQLRVRRDDRPDGRTWMEVYTGVAAERLAPFLATLERLASEHGAVALAPAGRHVEVFEAPSCA